MITLYGIPNCDSVKKAKVWLEQADIAFQFYNFKQQALSTSKIQQWLDTLGHDVIINKRSTTWKQLSESEKLIAESDQAAELIASHPTLVKRPVLETASSLHVGFKAALYQTLFS